jgi:outer membrane protein assembly factor BamB
LGNSDFATAVVSRAIYYKSTQGSILGGNSLIGDSVLFAISSTDAIYKMDINGNFLINLTVGAPILSTCSISYDTMIFLTSTDHNLYAFDKYFAPKWSAYPLGAVATTTPTIDSVSQRIFVGASNGNFFAINKNTGTNAWTFLADASVLSSAVISKNKNNFNDRKLVFVSGKGTLYGFNLNGQMMNPPSINWVKHFNDSVTTSPAIDNKGNFWIGTKSGKLYRVRLRNNGADSVLIYNFGSEITTSPVIDASHNIYVATLDKKLHSLRFNDNYNNQTSHLNWEYTSGYTIKSTPAISRSHRIYFGNDGGELIGLDTLNGNVKFYYLDSAHSKISCPVLYKCGSIYAGNEAGKVFAFFDSTSFDTTQFVDGIKTGVKSVPVWGVFQNNVERNGVGLCDTLDTGVRLISSNVPNRFELRQNYPNPFNPNTTINIQISSTCEVRLVVYDVLGKEIDVLVNQILKPGNYDVNWNAAKYSSGAYYYRIVAGDFVETKKMIILK